MVIDGTEIKRFRSVCTAFDLAMRVFELTQSFTKKGGYSPMIIGKMITNQQKSSMTQATHGGMIIKHAKFHMAA